MDYIKFLEEQIEKYKEIINIAKINFGVDQNPKFLDTIMKANNNIEDIQEKIYVLEDRK